jgi:AcrR family transcriptional regulator
MHPREVAGRRTRLLDAAADLFAEAGLESTTVADITTTAGVAKGSFYREFDSKEQIVVGLKQRYADELLERGASIAARLGTDDIWLLTAEFIESMIDFDLERRDLAVVWERGPSALAAIEADAEQRLVDMIAGGIRVGIAAGTFVVEDPDSVAAILLHGIYGILRHAILYDENVDRDRIVAAAKQVAYGALAGGAPSAASTAVGKRT